MSRAHDTSAGSISHQTDHDRNAPRPIFIIGSPRSGTTLLRLILDSHPNISCGPETHFLRHLKKIISRDWEGIKHYDFAKEYWYLKMGDFFGSFKTDHARIRGKTRWADKTPPYTLHVNFINKVFPDCQFIHLIRDGRDVVASHRDRWGFRTGLQSIETWRHFVEKGRRIARFVPEHRYHEVKYEDLVDNPPAAMRRVFDYLGEPWVPEVLEYDKFEHATPGPQAVHAALRRNSNGDDSLIYKSQVGHGKRRLGSILSLVLQVKGGKLLRDLGYK